MLQDYQERILFAPFAIEILKKIELLRQSKLPPAIGKQTMFFN